MESPSPWANVDVVELAKALLGDQSPADFLETGEPIVANYTATVSYKNAEIELAGHPHLPGRGHQGRLPRQTGGRGRKDRRG
ncbi:MAG: hypothetical protein ACOX18_06225 [Bacillota bacterium]